MLLSCIKRTQIFPSWYKDGRIGEEGDRRSLWCKRPPISVGDMRQKVKDSPGGFDDSQRRGTGEPPGSIWLLVLGHHEPHKDFTTSCP